MMVVESADHAMVLVDQAGHIVLANRLAERLFDYALGELLGKPVEILVPDRYRRKHSGFRNGYFAHATERPMGMGQIYARRRNGSEFPVEIGLKPIQTEEGLLVLGEIVDIGERSQHVESLRKFDEVLQRRVAEHAAELESADRELEGFAGTLVRNLRAPLREIEDAVDWLQRDPQTHLPDEGMREAIDLIRGRVSYIEKLLDEVLEYPGVRSKRKLALSQIRTRRFAHE